jgi:hypothetical protein
MTDVSTRHEIYYRIRSFYTLSVRECCGFVRFSSVLLSVSLGVFLSQLLSSR